MGEWINCFTDISTQEACTVTQNLDLDQMSNGSIRILKDTYMITLTFCCKYWVYSFCIYIYILGKWLQKEDIAETAVHFVLKWVKSIQLATIPGCWCQGILGTSLPHICPWQGACKVMQGHPEKNGLLNFLCDQSEKYGIMQRS